MILCNNKFPIYKNNYDQSMELLEDFMSSSCIYELEFWKHEALLPPDDEQILKIKHEKKER
jgi:hypothetical protein